MSVEEGPSCGADAVADVFTAYQQSLDEEQDKRESIRAVVRDLEGSARSMMTVLQTIHQPGMLNNLGGVCTEAQRHLQSATEQLKQLADLVPHHEYYRYHDHWRFVLQRLCFLCALQEYLEHDRLLTRAKAAQSLKLFVEQKEGFHLDLDDFLMGLLQLASELSRLAVNSVTAADYRRPISISKFMSEMSAAFRLLNLKNDSLRKRFDALKYDVKKVEEVVYDVTIRGLVTNQNADSDAAAK